MSTGQIKVEPDIPDGCWNCFESVIVGGNIVCKRGHTGVENCGLWLLDETAIEDICK